jgi:hypothetical protein
MEDLPASRVSFKIATLVGGVAAALIILAVPAAALCIFAAADAPPVSITPSDDLATYGVRPATQPASATPQEAKSDDAPSTERLKTWQYTGRPRPTINPPP